MQCYSDISSASGKILGGLQFPLIVGHEAAGIVESVGDENSTFKVNLILFYRIE
jgi:Zn-dependent alcohol dehydrogenase